MRTDAILEVEGLTKHFPVKLPAIQRLFTREPPVVHAVDGVSFTLRAGEIFGLVGESGCGKTTVGRTCLRLVKPTSGTIRFAGVDITRMKERDLRPLRRGMQIIFQDPHASLNPAMPIGESIGDPLRIHGDVAEAEARDATLAIMKEVGLSPPEQMFAKYPSDLSGGQKQRAVIARAMILRPRLIVADEPVAMLDMSIRARILELMLELKARHGLTYLFITHDLATAKFICDRIAIMYLGKIVEVGDAKAIYRDPKHPYTRALLGAVPIPDPDARRFKTLPKGEVPDAVYPPAGCRFHPRCPVATPTCGWEPHDVLDYLDQRALDDATAREDERVLGPREFMKADGQSLRIRVTRWSAGLSRRERSRSAIAVLVAAIVYAFVNPAVAAGVLAAGWASIVAVDAIARRKAFRMGWRPDPERVRSNLEGILKAAPDPMARAVERIAVAGDEVVVEFARAADPELRAAEDREVRCVLY